MVKYSGIVTPATMLQKDSLVSNNVVFTPHLKNSARKKQSVSENFFPLNILCKDLNNKKYVFKLSPHRNIYYADDEINLLLEYSDDLPIQKIQQKRPLTGSDGSLVREIKQACCISLPASLIITWMSVVGSSSTLPNPQNRYPLFLVYRISTTPE